MRARDCSPIVLESTCGWLRAGTQRISWSASRVGPSALDQHDVLHSAKFGICPGPPWIRSEYGMTRLRLQTITTRHTSSRDKPPACRRQSYKTARVIRDS